MKRISYLISLTLLTSLIISSCSDTTTYAELLKTEKVVIADFIKRNNIKVLKDLPDSNEVWGEKDYWLTPSGLYFHLVSAGTDTVTIVIANTVVPRYKQYSLTIPSDTISNWSTVDFPYPTTFVYGDQTQSCVAFHEAASLMKHNESEAKLIVPSKIGFEENMLTVTPLGYDLRIKIQR